MTTAKVCPARYKSCLSLDDVAEMDPFDESLDRRIWSLADTRLQWHKRIAETRRSVPAEIQSAVVDLLDRHKAIDATLLPVGSEVTDDESNPEGDRTYLPRSTYPS